MVFVKSRCKAYIRKVLGTCFFLYTTGCIGAQSVSSANSRIISEGILHYKVNLISPDAALQKAFDSTTQKIYLKGSLVRVDFENTLRNQTTLYKGATASGLVLKTSGGERYLTLLDSVAYAAYHAPFANLVWQNTGDTATFSNLFCHQYKGSNANSFEITLWLHPGILLFTNSFHPFFEGLTGLPVRYSYKSGNDTVIFTLQKIENSPVIQSYFEINELDTRIIEFKAPKQ